MGALYLQYEYWLAAMQLTLAMLGMGATLTLKDFEQVVKYPQAVTIGTLIQLIFVPLVAFLFIKLLGIVGGFAIGIALLAAIPGGTTSNIFTYFAKGNIPLSISITGLTTLACLVTTPVILSLLISDYLPANFVMPTSRIISDIAFTLLLPLGVGMLLLVKLPKLAPIISKWSIRLSLLGILLIVIGSISAGRLDLEVFGARNAVLVCLFVGLLWSTAWLLAKICGQVKSNRIAIEMEVLVRNVNLGILIKASMFPVVATNSAQGQIGDIVLFTILLYGALQMLIAALHISYSRIIYNRAKNL
ncbi:MAG: bile acid:sodium symporter [Acidiferrobacterales bacterium]|nr:bile acid:sodium symporter [Acidiferrobacterales bacterium]